VIVIKTREEIDKMRILGSQAAQILETLKSKARIGVTTRELDDLCMEECDKIEAKASSYGYYGFPGHLCISINETIIHGIPGSRKLKDGDMVSLDLVIERDGLFVDTAITFVVGVPTNIQRKLIDVCQNALNAGITEVRSGNRIGDIGFAIQTTVEKAGFSVIREYIGHGVGHSMHEDPQVPNFGKQGMGVKITPGMTFAIEPMISQGHWAVEVEEDGWTVNTADHSLSCHFEHTVATTEDEPIVLTNKFVKKEVL